MLRNCVSSLLFGSFYLLVFVSASGAQEPVVVPELPSAPVVDGVFDPVYAQGAALVDFWDFTRSVDQAVPSEEPVRAWLGHNDRSFYVFVECQEPQPGRMKKEATGHDEPVWGDDCVEIFLDPSGDRKTYYQLIMNSIGAKADLFNGQLSWNGDYQNAAKVWNASWTAEWAIPLSTLGITALEDMESTKKWTFNICREDKVLKADSTWVPLNVSVTQRFAIPDAFAEMVLVPRSQPGTYTLKNTPLRPQQTVRKMTWETKDPLYETLLSTNPRSLPNETGFYWGHPVNPGRMRAMATQYAVEYNWKDTLALFNNVNFHRIAGPNLNNDRNSNSDEVPFAWMANSARAKGKGMPSVNKDGHSILFAPENRAAYLSDVEETLCSSGGKKTIWGVFAGDEILDRQRGYTVEMFSKEIEKHAYLKNIDERITKKFGVGKYGIPKSSTDPERYRWIALNSWLDDEMCGLLEDLRKVVDRVAPGVRVISDDPTAGFKPFDFARRGKSCDVITQQIYPGRSPLRQEFGFIPKVLSDLSGKSAWPCPHVENYGASFTPEETAELLSQVFRCGGEGIHLYPSDVMGGRRQVWNSYYCAIGAPERWNTMYSIFQRIHTLPKLKLPEKSQTAILIEPSTSRSFRPHEGAVHLEYEMCFDLLGPHARSWFQFIHSAQILRKEKNLRDYKVVYVPMSRFFVSKTAKKLLDYAKGGGLVISVDPQAFRYAADIPYKAVPIQKALGWSVTDASAEHTSLKILDASYFAPLASGAEIPFGIKLVGWKPELNGSWVTLATFENGDPAILTKCLGKGVWIQFTFQPFELDLLPNEKFRALFKSMQQAFGQPTDLDIWRFTFPIAETPKEPSGECLTGNAVEWKQNIPRPIGGKGVAGVLRWSLPPKGVSAESASFANSPLCDRRKALDVPTRNEVSVAQKEWCCTWERNEPFDLEIKIPESQNLRELVFWYSGTLPAVQVSTGSEGTKLAESAEKSSDSDVLVARYSLGSVKTDSIKIHFDKRTGDKPLTLVELEIWTPVTQ